MVLVGDNSLFEVIGKGKVRVLRTEGDVRWLGSEEDSCNVMFVERAMVGSVKWLDESDDVPVVLQ